MVTHHYLHGNGGGVYASRAYINAFAEIADYITLLYPMKEGLDIEGISNKVNAIPIYNKKGRVRKALGLLTGKIHRYFDCFENYLKQADYDYVVFDSSYVSFRLIDIAHQYGCKVITIHHNYQVEYVKGNSTRFWRGIYLYWVKRLEKESILKSDLNLTLTKQDCYLLAKHYADGNQEKIEVLGCFESTERSVVKALHKKNRYRFIITGSLGDVQTEMSLIPWLESYYPILKDVIPDADLVIAGRNPSERLIELCKNKGVLLIPSPKKMQPLLDAADFYICPTSLGGGLKLRVMDGLKCGLPIICHEVSARGYDIFVDKGYVFVYNDVSSFRECLNVLIKSSFNHQDVQDLYESVFAFNAGIKRLKNNLQKII